MSRLDNDSIELLLGFYRERLRCEDMASARRRSVNAIRLALSRTRARLRDCVRSRLAQPSTMRSRRLPETSDAGRPGVRAVAGLACWEAVPVLTKTGAVTIRSPASWD